MAPKRILGFKAEAIESLKFRAESESIKGFKATSNDSVLVFIAREDG